MSVTMTQLIDALAALGEPPLPPPLRDREYWLTPQGRRYLDLLAYVPSALASWADEDARGSDDHPATRD